MNFLFSRIQNKLIAAFVLVLLIPLLAVGLFSYRTANSVLKNAWVNEQVAQIEGATNTVNSFLENVMYEVLYLTQNENLQKLISARQQGSTETIDKIIVFVENDFLNFANIAGIYHKVCYIDEKGNEIVSIQNVNNIQKTIPPDKLENLANHNYFQETMKLHESRVYVSNIELNEIAGDIEVPHTPIIRYATPIFYTNGQRAGVVMVKVLANYFLGAFKKATGEEGFHYLVDSQTGHFFLHHEESKRWGRDRKTGITLKTEYPEIFEAVEKLDHRGVQQVGNDILFVSDVKVPGITEARWDYISVNPVNILMMPLRNFTYTFILLAIIALGAAIVLAILIARGISSPVKHLSQVADRISQGELEVEIKVTTRDEIFILAESLERMRNSLQSAINRLRKRKV